MKVKVTIILKAVSLSCALVAIGAVLFWAPVCSGSLELANGNMAPMRCAYAGKTALLLAAILAIVATTELVSRRSAPAATVAVVALSVALVVVTFATPVSGGICASADMACQTTALWLRLCGGVSAVAAVGAAVLNPERKRVRGA